jgi:hypothetical protein
MARNVSRQGDIRCSYCIVADSPQQLDLVDVFLLGQWRETRRGHRSKGVESKQSGMLGESIKISSTEIKIVEGSERGCAFAKGVDRHPKFFK